MKVIGKDFVKSSIKKRPYDAHKGSMGSLLSICGSYGMAGAAILSSRAALKSGLGLLYTAVPKSIYPICAGNIPESVFIPLDETESGTFHQNGINQILAVLPKVNAVLFGCGTGNDDNTFYILDKLIENINVPLIVDADGINCLSRHIDVLSKAKNEVIITPHPGEMARLINSTAEKVNINREKTAVDFANGHRVYVVLKGAETIVASPKEEVRINQTGNPGMATGGSGDVLAGIIASFCAQGLSAYKACCSGVYIHGFAGDIAAQKHGQVSMLPSDIINNLYNAFNKTI